MRILNIMFLFLSFGLFAQEQEQKLSEAELNSFQDSIFAKAKNLKSLQADFVQTKHMKMMDDEAESTGRVYFKTPDVLKWEYQEPYDYKILFKDGELHINDEGHKSSENTGSNALFKKLGKIVSGSVNGKLLEDAENFDITYYKKDNKIVGRLIPLDEKLARIFSEVLMEFDEENLVKSVRLKEENGDFTLIEFQNVQINEEIEASVFEQ